MNLKEHIVFLQEAVTVKKMEEGDFPDWPLRITECGLIIL